MSDDMNLSEIMGVVRSALEGATCDQPHSTPNGYGACDTWSPTTCEESHRALSAMTLTKTCRTCKGSGRVSDPTAIDFSVTMRCPDCVDGQIERTIESVIAELEVEVKQVHASWDACTDEANDWQVDMEQRVAELEVYKRAWVELMTTAMYRKGMDGILKEELAKGDTDGRS